MSLNPKEKEVLKKLGARYMDLASLPIQKKKMELWKALNRSKMQRPMVCIDQLPWNELNVDSSLTLHIKDPYWRNVEWDLRTKIYKWTHFPVDMVLEPYIEIPKIIHNSGYGLRPDVQRLELSKDTTAAAQHFTNILKDYEDIEKIKDIHITYDHDQSEAYYQQAQEIFNGIAPVIQSHGIQFHLGAWDFLTQLMSIEDAYYNIMDRPKFIHACMERMTQSIISGVQQANELQVHNDISNTCHCSYVYTDELLPDFAAGKGSVSKNSWAFGLAQLFSSASPKVTEEFELPYISRIAEHFGMIYYGCCEGLDDRLDVVKKIPNVRKVSCSPWSNRKRFAERIGDKLIMSNKPSPAFLATSSVDWDGVKKDLQMTVDYAKENSVNLEFILKDISTVQFQPERLTKWAEIAMEVAEGI